MKEQTSYNDKRKKAIIILIILLLLLAFLGSFFFIRGRLNASAAEQAGIAEENGNNEAQNNEVSSTTNTENNTVTNTTETLQAVTTNTRRENNGSTNANSGTNNGNDNQNDNSNNNQNTNNSNNNPSNDNQNGNEEPADTVAPEITGIEDGKVYAESVTVTISADDLEKAICKFVAEDGTESEYEFSSGKEFTESGKYILIVTDKSGNKTEISFTIDKNAPEITGVEDGKIYNVDVTPVISDKNLKKVTYKLNDGEENDLEEGTTLVEEGIYTITAEDEAGNKVEISFEIDKTAPVYTNLGIIRNKAQNDTRDTSYAKDGDSVRVLVAFAEKLAVEPTVKVGDKEYVATYRPLSSNEAENVFYYMADIDVTEEIPEGKIEFSIEEYADIAGNVGTTLSNTDINMDYASVTVDRTAPVLTVKDESIGTDPYYSKISFKLYDNNAVVKYILNGTEKTCTPNDYSDANYDNIKSLLVEGENTITLVDIAGNEVTRTFIYDTTKPTITWNGNVYEDGAETIYTNGRFTLNASDENGISKVYSNNHERKNGWSASGESKYTIKVVDMAGNEAIFTVVIDKTIPKLKINGTEYADSTEKIYLNAENYEFENVDKNADKIYVDENEVTDAIDLAEGTYLVKLTDKAGNEVTYTLVVDRTLPEITVKDESIGTDPYYSKISFKLYDNNAVVKYILNGTEKTCTPNNYSDANYDNIKNLLVEGENTITLVDIAGNEATRTFVYDTTAPVYTTLGIVRNKTENDTRNQAYAKDGDSVRILISFAEKLAVEPTIKIGEAEHLATYRPLSSDESNNVFFYMADIDVTTEIPEGEIKFSVNGYADAAGNVGKTLTNGDINRSEFSKVIVDRILPEITVKDESIGTDPYYSRIGFKLHDNNAVVKYILNGTEKTCSVSPWSDANYVNIKNLLVEGENTITLVDIAGNEVTRTFIYDITSPTAVVTYSNDNGKAMTNQDVTVTLTASEDIKDIEGWTKVDSKTFTKVYSENGKHSVEIEDKAGNKATVNYEVKRIDKVAPVIDLSNTKSTFEVGVDVYTYPENITIYDESDKAISVSKLNIQWFKANADGSKGEPVANFEWNTTLKNRELGDYYIYYYIRDKAGNLAETHRIVTLQDTTKPEIIINGNSEEHISLGSEYTDAGFTVSDNRDDASQITTVTKITWYSLTGDSSEVNQVNKDIEGRYNIDYIATDRAGNKQKATRLVYVEDNTTLDFDGISYDTSVNGEVTVTITANKKIKLNSGWEYTDSSKKAMYRVYTENTDYLGEDITVSDLKGATKVANILVTSIVTNGTRNVNVTSKAGFDKLVVDMRSGVTFKNAVINIDTDIDLSNENWTSIYAGQNNNIFSNTIIDGKEHKITGMKVSRNPATNDGSSEATQYGIGFIGDLNGSLTIKNLTFDGAQVIDANGGTGSNYSQHYAGVVVGHTDAKLKLENVNVSNSKVLNSWQCGGLVGFSGEDITFDNCSVSNIFVGGANATSGALFGMGYVNVNINNCKANKVKLYSDGLTWDSVQKIDSIYWIGDNYKYHSHSGKTISIDANSTITDVSFVDTLE